MQPEHHYVRTSAHVPSTAPRFLARALSGPRALAIVFLAAVGARVALAWGSSTPWIAPDEMLYALLGESMWSGRLEVLGEPSGYYGLYPLLPGGLVRVLGPDHARIATLLVQTVAGCSTAIVTYLWARHLASARWSLGIACAVLALPALDYSALMMTESVSLLAVTSALYLLWRSFAYPSWWAQIFAGGAILLASQVRLQALLLLPATILAVALFCLRRTSAPAPSRPGTPGHRPGGVARRLAARGGVQRDAARRLLVGDRHARLGRPGAGVERLAPGRARGHDGTGAPRGSRRARPTHRVGAR